MSIFSGDLDGVSERSFFQPCPLLTPKIPRDGDLPRVKLFQNGVDLTAITVPKGGGTHYIYI